MDIDVTNNKQRKHNDMRNYLTRILFSVTMLIATTTAWAQQVHVHNDNEGQYVISYTTSDGTTHFLAMENDQLVDATSFNPQTCIWGYCSSWNRFFNGQLYKDETSADFPTNGLDFNFNDNDLTLVSTGINTWKTNNGHAYIDAISGRSHVYYFLIYNNGAWGVSDVTTSLTPGDNAATISPITIEEHEAQGQLYVTYNADTDNGFEREGDARDYYVSDAKYTPAYKAYTFNGTTYYYPTDFSFSSTVPPTPLGLNDITAGSYKWTSSHPGNVTVTQSQEYPDQATADYATKFDAETFVTITVSATISKDKSPFLLENVTLTGSATADLLSRDRMNLILSVGKNELYIGETTKITDTSEHDGAVSYSVSDTNIATIDTDGTFHAVGTNGADFATVTVTVSKPLTDKYEAATAKTTITIRKHSTTITLSYDKNTLTYGDEAPKLTSCVLTDTYDSSSETDKTMIFTSSDNCITVDANTGELTVNYAGTATITATYIGDDTHAGSKGTFTITVNKAQTTLSFPQGSYNVLYTQGFSDAPAATLTPAEAGTVTYSCTSDPDGFITVNASTGAVTINGNESLMEGSATITATFAGDNKYEAATASYELVVTTRLIPNIEIDMENLLYVDGTNQITVDKDGSTGALSYKSSDTKIVTVTTDGLVTATGEGTAYVTISMEGDKDYMPMSISFPVIVQRIPTQLTLHYQQDTYYSDHADAITPIESLVETLQGQGLSGRAYTFASNNPAVLTVDANTGQVTIVGEGEAVVTATFAGDRKYAPSQAHFTIHIVSIAVPGSFIRLKDTNGNYLASDGTTVSCTSSAAHASSIIYYGTDQSLLFYECGRYIKDASATLADVVNNGTSGTKFTITHTRGIYTISTGNSSMIAGGNTDWEVEIVHELPVTFKDAGYGYSTLYCPVDLQRPAGVICYYPASRTADDGDPDYTITLRTIDHGYIPANTPVIMKTGDVGTYYFTITSGVQSLTDVADFMTGTIPAITTASVYSGDQCPYTLQPNKSSSVGFYPWLTTKHSTIDPFRCYIPGDKVSETSTSPAKGFRFVFEDDDDTTAIESIVSPSSSSGMIYNLHGIAVGTDINALPAGIYIQGGKKVKK